MDLILKPVRVATSRPARQTYLNTLLFSIASSILLGLAVVAYILFYIEYIPQIGIERVVHLQYGDGPHPYGIALLDSSIVHDQAYDISLSLHVPRSPPNLAAGNFMISLSLLSPTYTPPPPSIAAPSPHQPSLSSTIPPSAILFTSRRPALIPYTSRLVSLSTRLLALPLYLLGIARESDILSVPMAESASFARGRRNLPARILLELHAASAPLQVYDVRVRFTARFAGLRWLMYNHRIVSFVVFTTAFWVAEMVFSVLGWLALKAYLEEHAGRETVKEEESDDVDSSDGNVPSAFRDCGRPHGRQATVKNEDSEGSGLDEKAITEMATEVAEEEVKDEKSGLIGLGREKADSAIGTSFSEGSGVAGMSRRKSRGGHVVE